MTFTGRKWRKGEKYPMGWPLSREKLPPRKRGVALLKSSPHIRALQKLQPGQSINTTGSTDYLYFMRAIQRYRAAMAIDGHKVDFMGSWGNGCHVITRIR